MLWRPYFQRIVRNLILLVSLNRSRLVQHGGTSQDTWPVPSKERGGRAYFPWYFQLDFKVECSPLIGGTNNITFKAISPENSEKFIFSCLDPPWLHCQPSCLVKVSSTINACKPFPVVTKCLLGHAFQCPAGNPLPVRDAIFGDYFVWLPL